MSNFLSSNLKFLRKKFRKSQSDIGFQLNKAHTSIGNWEKGISEPSFAEVDEIARIFEIKPEMLLYVDLEKVQDSPNSKNGHNMQEKVQDIVQDEAIKGGYLLAEPAAELLPNLNIKARKSPTVTAPKVITVDSSGNENVLYVPVKARAGYLTGMADPKYIQSLPAYGLPGYHNGTYRIFEIDGPSMFPTFQDKDRCVTRWAQVSDIRDDRVYVVITRNDGILIKRCINRMNEGKIICKSDNNLSGEYPPIVLEVSEILEVWYVVERWTRQMPGPGEIYKRIVNLEAAVTLLTHRLDHPR